MRSFPFLASFGLLSFEQFSQKKFAIYKIAISNSRKFSYRKMSC